MKSEEIRKKFLEFFEARGHAIVPSSSLIPDDPSVLFTTAGMQQFKKYFTGELDPVKDFGSKNTVSVQKCFRTSDIDEVGDESHLTFFEMFGNFSFGGYWKEEAIQYGYDFITKEMGLKIDYVSVFKGDPSTSLDSELDSRSSGQAIPADEESAKIWKSIDKKIDVRLHDREDNFWGPTGNEGPCGPTTEIYVNGVEIWNIVFNEYYSKNGKLTPLKIKGVDTGMGLERLAVAVQKVKNVYETDLFSPIIKTINTELPEYKNNSISKRISADHIRAITFLISEGILPSNKDSGYALRRIMRRITIFGINDTELSKLVIKQYGIFYKELLENEDTIVNTIINESTKFSRTLKEGLNELKKMEKIDAIKLYQSFGLPIDYILDEAKKRGTSINEEEFEKWRSKHQEISRAGAEKKFGGHGLVLDTGELKAGNEEELKQVTRLHTATHLLNQALREILGDGVEQRGSDITPERARFDFTFGRKMTPEEIKTVESLVNEKIKEGLKVSMKEMPKTDAEKTGALHFFKGKYPDNVSVYYISSDGTLDYAWSKEFCGGPHVKNTSEIGGIKILKEEASSAGVRRIRIALV